MDLSRLTEEQQLALQQFTSVTDQGHEAAIPLLERCQWNVQIAIARFFDGEPADPIADAIPAPQDIRRQEVLMNGFSSSSRRASRDSGLEPAPRIVPQPENQQVARPAPLILSLLFAPVNLMYSLLSKTFGILGYLFPFLPRILNAISGRAGPASRRNTSGRRALNSRDTAARFIREVEEEYGPNDLPFFEGGYAQAFDAAKRDLKFLLVTILSPEHDDTSSFVRDTLLSPELSAFLASHKTDLLLWAGNVQDPEAYQVSTELHCTKFPFSALIVHTPSQSSTSMSTVLRIAGPTRAPTYVSRLQSAIAQHAGDLDRARATRAEQQATRSLRQEQESAYERSLAQDRERARARREAEAADRRARDAKSARERAARLEASRLRKWRRRRAGSIAPEPGQAERDAVRVSVRLPDGERVVRRFAAKAPLEELYAFVECYDVLQGTADADADNAAADDDDEEGDEGDEKVGAWEHEYRFRLVSPMPRQVYGVDSAGTLAERLGRSANLIVERVAGDGDTDDDDDDGEEGVTA